MVVDDHPVFRMGLIALLSSIDGLEVVAQADSVASAIAAAERNDVDVVMMDLNLGDESGVEATREIVARRPNVGVLVVTMVDDDDTVFAAMRAGARGYLLEGRRAGRDRARPAGGRGRRGAAGTGDRRQRGGDAHRFTPPRSRSVPVADRSRARGARARRRGTRQPAHRPAPGAEREDRAQQPLDGAHQARRRRPRGGDRQGPRRRPRSRRADPGQRGCPTARHGVETPVVDAACGRGRGWR